MEGSSIRLKNLIPSMFHRRLALLSGFVVLSCLVLVFKLAQLTLVQGAEFRQSAESVLVTRHFIPTVRGEILDRKGRLLAIDRPCHDIRLSYKLIGGDWATREARRKVYRQDRKAWRKMSEMERQLAIADDVKIFDAQREQALALIARETQTPLEELLRRIDFIRQRVNRVKLSVWQREVEAMEEELGEEVDPDRIEAPTVEEEKQTHVLIAGVDDEVALRLETLLEQLGKVSEQIDLVESRTRAYPLEIVEVELDTSTLPGPIARPGKQKVNVRGVATHIIGMQRDVWAEGVQAQPFLKTDGTVDLKGYRPGDQIGRMGVERSEESRLRGARGKKMIHLDTQTEERIPAIAGQPVQLTLDAMLQAKVQAIMDPAFGLMKVQPWHDTQKLPMGMSLNGSAIVLDVESGDILAMVSTPGYTREDLKKHGARIASDPDQPMVNRPLSAIYPPASTMKPIVYALSVDQGILQWDEVMDCKGHLFPDKPMQFREWGWRPERGMFLELGPLDASGAIKMSSNYYFYTCGLRMGPVDLIKQYHRWGIGQPINVGLPESNAGILPRLDVMRNRPGRELNQSNGIFLAIGQGPIAIPPIQVANAHAALAREGLWKSPVLIENRRRDQKIRDLRVSHDVWLKSMKGMWLAANDPQGTGHHLPGREPIFNVKGVTVRGKTGTAQASLQWEDTNKSGKYDKGDRIVRSGNHGWYVAHVSKEGTEKVEYVICVMVEYGQSGGRSAGPVVNQIIHAMQQEGYFK